MDLGAERLSHSCHQQILPGSLGVGSVEGKMSGIHLGGYYYRQRLHSTLKKKDLAVIVGHKMRTDAALGHAILKDGLRVDSSLLLVLNRKSLWGPPWTSVEMGFLHPSSSPNVVQRPNVVRGGSLSCF